MAGRDLLRYTLGYVRGTERQVYAGVFCVNNSLCGFCTAIAKLDVGVAYAIWAALGTVVVTASGVLFFHEAMDPLKLISVMFVIFGVVGLNLSDGH